MPIPFSKVVEDSSFGGPRFIPIAQDGAVVYITDTDILAAVAIDGSGTLQIRRSTDGGSTWNAIAQTFNVNGNGWLFEFQSTIYLIQYNNLTPSSTPFEQWDGIQFQGVAGNNFPFGGTNNFVYNVRIIDNVAYIILVEYTQPGPQKNTRVYTWDGTTMTLFRLLNDAEYRDIAKVGSDLVLVGFSHDATGDFSISSVWDGVSFTDYPSPSFAGKRIIEHLGSHYVLDVPDQGSQPFQTRIARINTTDPLSLSAGLTLEFAGNRIVGRDLFSDGVNLYVLSVGQAPAGAGSLANNPRVFRYSLIIFQIDEESFIFPTGTFIAKQAPRAADTVLVMNWNEESASEVFRLYEYDFGTPAPGTNFDVTENKLIEVGEVCQEAPVYLSWINRLGGREFWLFDQETENFEDKIRTRAEGEIRSEVLQIDEQRGNFKQIGNSEVATLRIGADGLSQNRVKAIREMFSSPNILMLVSAPGETPIKWIQVAVRPGSFSNTKRQSRIQFEIQLPDRFIQQN